LVATVPPLRGRRAADSAEEKAGHFGRDDMPGVRFGRNAYSEKWAPQGLFFQLVSPLSRLCRTLLQAMASVILNHPLPGSGSRL